VEAAGGLLRVVLVNRDTVQRPVTVALASGGTRNVRVFGFDGATRLASLGGAVFGGGQLTLDLPARSARLLEVAPESATPPASAFYTLSPCRVVDTRNAAGPFGGPALAAGETRSFALTQGACGLPADATAVALNVTTTDATGSGLLTLWPGSGAAPDTSTIVFRPGAARANNSVMGLSGGVLSVLNRASAGQVDLILDVSGYFR
jgi:hypothetical protein